ncbi:seminase [Drosophila yakuba]|uniref:Peptidase S1 domain-containing protein n=1 Tax=Drosophila yakuba TaxID=7245 RepID=B4PR69_DROYA|nr:seminase [Drosophila yakuba]EDW98433.2 uncharacterized protein Dyak_GE10519 [Drosophila yakuba]
MESGWALVWLLCILISVRTEARHKGHRHARIQPRIYNGKLTKVESLGGVGIQLFNKKSLVCTATLLTSRHILTAAHCFEDAKQSDFHVIGGMSDEFRRHDTHIKKNKLIKVRIHPKFAKEKFIADIAVAKIKYPLQNKNVGYAQICQTVLRPKDKLIAAGWGFQGGIWDELKRKALRSMTVGFVSKGACEKQLGRKMPPNVICAGAYNNQTLCFGDSGGPLLLGRQVCGVNTWTFRCGNNEKPDVYMGVRYYAPFINRTIQEMGY